VGEESWCCGERAAARGALTLGALAELEGFALEEAVHWWLGRTFEGKGSAGRNVLLQLAAGCVQGAEVKRETLHRARSRADRDSLHKRRKAFCARVLWCR